MLKYTQSFPSVKETEHLRNNMVILSSLKGKTPKILEVTLLL